MKAAGKWRVPLLILSAAFAVAVLPLLTVNCIGGHDIDYHLLRIEALKTGILEGLPFLRVNLLYFGGEGYASSLFYPDGLLFVPALLRAAGVGINASFHLFVGLCVLLCLASSFLSAYYCTESTTAAVITAVAVTLYQYHIDDLYTRAAVGEYTAFIFVPVVIAGLYDLLAKNLKKPWILGLGMTGVILTHTITTVFCLCLCAAAFMIYLFAGEKKKRAAGTGRLFLTALSVLALTAFYWLPVLEQMRSNVFRYRTASFDVYFERLLFRDVFLNRNPGMGIAPFLLLLPGVLIAAGAAGRQKPDGAAPADAASCGITRRGFALICLFSGLAFTLLATGAFPWKRLSEELQFIQFPWRAFILSGPLFAFASGIYFEELSGIAAGLFSGEEAQRERLRLFFGQIFAVLVLAVMIVSAVGNYARNEEEYYSYSGDYFDYPRYTEHVIGGEWLPENADDRHRLTDDAGVAYTPQGGRLPVTRDKNTLSLTLSGTEAYVDVPFVWYLGYRAVEPSTGRVLQSDGSGENGRMRVFPEGAEALRVYYAGTALQKAGDVLSLLTLLLLTLVFGIMLGITKNKKRSA